MIKVIFISWKLNAQLQIMVKDPSLAEFKPDLAIDMWWERQAYQSVSKDCQISEL